MSKLYTTDCLNPYQRETVCNHPSSSENHVLSTSEHPMDPKQVCKFKFVRCGPVKNTVHSICLGLVIAAQQSLGAPFSKLRFLMILAEF